MIVDAEELRDRGFRELAANERPQELVANRQSQPIALVRAPQQMAVVQEPPPVPIASKPRFNTLKEDGTRHELP